MNSVFITPIISGSFITNELGILLHTSSNLNKWLGYSPDELIGESFTKLFTNESGQELLNSHLNSFLSATEQAHENTLRHKNGHLIPVAINAVSITNADGTALIFFTLNKMTANYDGSTQAEMELAFLLSHTEECFVLVDTNLTIIRFNKQFFSLYKKYLGKEIFIGNNILDYSTFSQREKLNELYLKVLQGATIDAEIEIPRKNEKPVSFYLKYKPARDNTGNIMGVFVSGIDITERIISQQALLQKQLELEQAETSHRQIFEKANEKLEISQQVAKLGLWEFDLITNEMYFSDETYRIFGLQKGGVAADFKTLVDTIHPLDRQLFETEFRYALVGEKLLNVEHRIITPTGLVKTVVQRGSVIYDTANHPARFSGTIHDITERKYMEVQLWASQRQLDLIYNTVNEMIFLIDVEDGNRFRFQSVNKAFFINTGLQKEQVLNKYIEDIIPATSYPLVLENYMKAIQTGKSVSWEETNQYPTGEKTGIVTVTPILDDNGACLQLIGSIYDITALKISGDKLEKLNAQLKYQAMALAESNLELERFAYVASHDLQEPLRMVSSFLQLLEKKYKNQLDETGSKYIYYAVDGAERMQKLILDLLEYSRVNTNNDATGDTDMSAVTKEILHIMDSKIKELNAIVEVGPLPVLARTRRTQMFQLMQNLISNAFKYHGTNRLHISINAAEENNKWIFYVNDNGIGFDETFAEKVFIIFQRLHNKSEYSGTGIGLAICKKIVERYNGKIWVKTSPGKGSCFYFSISK